MTQHQTAKVIKYHSFKEFYPFYLSQHNNSVCRLLHFIGSLAVLIILASVVISGSFAWLVALPVAGYGFAWIGHFIFEKNRPATFTYPLYSFAGDWLMFWEIVTGKISFKY